MSKAPRSQEKPKEQSERTHTTRHPNLIRDDKSQRGIVAMMDNLMEQDGIRKQFTWMWAPDFDEVTLKSRRRMIVSIGDAGSIHVHREKRNVIPPNSRPRQKSIPGRFLTEVKVPQRSL